MRTVYWLLVLVVAISGTALVTQRAGAAAASAAPVAPPIVEVSPIGTVKDVMKGIVDPNARRSGTRSGPNPPPTVM